MKITLIEIHKAKPALMRLAKEKLPTKIAYRIQKNIRTLEPIVSQYQKELREIVFVKYNCKHLGNGTYEPADKGLINELDKDVKSLGEKEVEINIVAIPMLSIDSISALDLIDLEFMLSTEAERKT